MATFRNTAKGTLTAAAARSVLEIATPSSIGASINIIDVAFDGTAGNNALIELVRKTATGTGTSQTPMKSNALANNRAAICTAKVNNTVEATSSGEVILGQYQLPMSALFPQVLPLDEEIYVPPSSFFVVRLTSPTGAAPVYTANWAFKEE